MCRGLPCVNLIRIQSWIDDTRCRFSCKLDVRRGNRLEIIIDIFLPNWQRQNGLVRMPGATINSTETHKRVTREGRGRDSYTRRTSAGQRVVSRRSNRRGGKRDLKISMQIRRIIIPTVRLAPGSCGSPLI